MGNLVSKVRAIKNSPVRALVESRLKELSSFKKKSNSEWFSELCFCILTANSRAKTAINIQNELGYAGFANFSRQSLTSSIRRNKHRFHNMKARYIVAARKNLGIKDMLSNIIENDCEPAAREWLVNNIKGLGYKESSHFLRNVGYFNFAILDRHILNLMHEHGVIKEKPKPVTKQKYFEIESKFKDMAEKLSMSPAELDFYMWYMKTGEVLK